MLALKKGKAPPHPARSRFYGSVAACDFFEARLPQKGYASLRPDDFDFAKNQTIRAWGIFKTKNLTASPNAERQTGQLRLIFLFSPKNKKAVQDTHPVQPENSDFRPFVLDFHTQSDTI
jgi:hypothetical protein